MISVIGLLASVMLVALDNSRIKARDARRKVDITQLQKALEFYYDDNNNTYPASSGATTPNNSWYNSADSSWNSLATALSKYMTKLPKDPLENNNSAEWALTGYHYSYFSNAYGCPGQWYMIVFKLENSSGETVPLVTLCDGITTVGPGGTLNYLPAITRVVKAK